jgi:hypothetical protein
MTLSDLEIVFDILESLPVKLHYIERRAELEANTKYIGDETDLLGFYLETGFNIGEAELGTVQLNLLGASKRIDEYYMGIDDDVSVRKPGRRMTAYWRDLCLYLEKRQFHQWTEVGVVLQNFSFEQQQKILRSFKKIVKNVRRRWRQPNHRSAIIMIPDTQRPDALAIYAFREKHSREKKDRMSNIAAQIFENSESVNRCVVVATNIDRTSYPYSTLAVLYRGDEGKHVNDLDTEG